MCALPNGGILWPADHWLTSSAILSMHNTTHIWLHDWICAMTRFRFMWAASGASASGIVKTTSQWGLMADWCQMESMSSTGRTMDHLPSGWRLKDNVVRSMLTWLVTCTVTLQIRTRHWLCAYIKRINPILSVWFCYTLCVMIVTTCSSCYILRMSSQIVDKLRATGIQSKCVMDKVGRDKNPKSGNFNVSL